MIETASDPDELRGVMLLLVREVEDAAQKVGVFAVEMDSVDEKLGDRVLRSLDVAAETLRLLADKV